MSPDPDFAWLEQIILADGADGEVVQAGAVAVVVRRRPMLLDLAREAWPRIARMGVDAIAECHAAGQPAWVSEGGTIWRLDPDGTRHVEAQSGGDAMTWSPDPWSYAMKVADACAARGATSEAVTREGRQAILDDELEHCPGSEQGLTKAQVEALAGWVEGRTSSADLSAWMLLMVMAPPDDGPA